MRWSAVWSVARHDLLDLRRQRAVGRLGALQRQQDLQRLLGAPEL